MKAGMLSLFTLVSVLSASSQPTQHSDQQIRLHAILKLVHEDNHNPIAFTVPMNATSAQLEQIVWEIRKYARAHQFPVLGMHIGDANNRYDTSGMIAIYRGRRCVKEAYTDGPMPCGDYPNYDAYYQWGMGGIGLNTKERYECDAGGSRRQNGRLVDLFNEGRKCEQLAESRGKAPQVN